MTAKHEDTTRVAAPQRHSEHSVKPQAEPEPPAGSLRALRLDRPEVMGTADILALQGTLGNQAVMRLIEGARSRSHRHEGTASGAIQRDKLKGEPAKVQQAKQALKQALGGKTASDCKKQIEKRLPDGPLFTSTEIGDIIELSNSPGGATWLKQVGIGTFDDAYQYLIAANYKDWLKLNPGKRVLLAALAWGNGFGKDDANPPPSFTLGRHMAIGKGNLDAQTKQQAEAGRDKQIRDAFVNTLSSNGLNKDATTAIQSGAMVGKTIQAVKAENAQANQILTKVFLILQVGLQVYDRDKQMHIDYKEGDVARALAHGGRVNIRIPALGKGQSAYELTDWLGITQGGKDAGGAVFERGFGTHHMKIGANKPNKPGSGSFKEKGDKGAAMSNKKAGSAVKLYGMNVSAGGIGNKDFNGDVILPDGAHGHMFIGFKKPTRTKDGALQIGMETTGPGAPSLVGYEHNWNSTEATANPESSFYGHKTDKIGGGKLSKNQRMVDLNRLQTAGSTWLDHLNVIEQEWNKLLAAADSEEAAYEKLVGKQGGL